MRPRRGALLGLGAAVLMALAGIALGARLLGLPPAAAAPPPDPGAGLRAQQRLAELLMRAGGVTGRSEPIPLTTAELNALLTRHVQTRRLPLYPVVLRAEEGVLEVAGRTSLRQLGPRSALGGLISVLPDGLLDLEVWVAVEGRVEARAGEGELVVGRAAIGRQRVPPSWLWALLGLDPREYLVWRMPRFVDRVEVRPDRLLIHTRR